MNFSLTNTPLDSTPPAISPHIDGTSGQNGWYTSDVAVSWTVTDNESPITSKVGCDPISITSDQAETAYTCEATSAGGAGSETVSIKRDATPPVVAVTGVSEGATYILGAVPEMGCTTSDAMSDVAVNASLSLTGGNALGVGQFTATCSGAMDNAGNGGNTVVVHYNVTFLFTGFSQPVDNNSVLNTAKAGQMIPLKWRLLDASGNPVLNLDPANVTLTISPYTCPSGVTTDAIETYATGTSSLQNLGDGYYQLNWKTPSTYANSCKTLRLDLGEGIFHTALFQFKK